MRHLRAAIVVGIATTALSLPSAALAQIDSLWVSDPRLGPEGGSVVVTMGYCCDVGFNAFDPATFTLVTESSGPLEIRISK
jgi:hypothetical protein